jgi:GrpB-like predicted nucleotidyltransferase (UPF0157 family)
MRHPSLDERFDPTIRIVDYDSEWPMAASEEHVCEAGSEHEFRHLAVRNFLRAHSDEAARYAALKREIAARHPQDRLAYIEAKQEYTTDLEARAVAWALSA